MHKDNDILIQVSDNIRIARTKKRLSQEKLAEMIDISTKYLNMIENRKANPTIVIVIKICLALGIELQQTSPGYNLIAHSSTHNKLTCCDTGTVSGNAIFTALPGASYRFINTSDIDIRLVPNDLYSGSVSITRIL